jgi:tRNA G18 (ribose-2'-O)-methylase SpoU
MIDSPTPKKDLCIMAVNVRSAHNVGSLMRTMDGLGLKYFISVGYTPYIEISNDNRLPHIRKRANALIHKTALGAENSVTTLHFDTFSEGANYVKSQGYELVALEQAATSVDLKNFELKSRTCLVLGNEVNGLEKSQLETVDKILEIPMAGQKESFNVAEAAAMAMFYLLNKD